MCHLQHNSRRSLFPWVSLAINGILTSVYYEVPNIACAAFAEFVNFHSIPPSLWWYVLNPTQSSFPEEERLVDTGVSFWCVYRGKLGFYRASCNADQGQIWNCRQSEGSLGGDGIFSLSLFVRSMASQYFPFWRNTFHSQVSVQHHEVWEVQLGFSLQSGLYPSNF